MKFGLGAHCANKENKSTVDGAARATSTAMTGKKYWPCLSRTINDGNPPATTIDKRGRNLVNDQVWVGCWVV